VHVIDSIFRQYDIRGKVGSELLLEEVYDLGRAIACYFFQKNPYIKTIALGIDGRTHSKVIKEQLTKAFLESGINIIFIGVCPTPVLYFSLFTLSVDGGIIVTASHNGKEYNGFKICLGKESVWGDQIQEIKKLYKKKAALPAKKLGSYIEEDVITRYVAWMKDHFKHLVGMELSALTDCGNGAGGTVLPYLIQAMQWPNVQLLFAEVDGTYPNHEADPIVEKNMQDLKKALLTSKISLGIGLDGDCDRMAPMTKDGQIIVGDKLLAVFAEFILENHPGATIIYDTKCSAGLTELLEQLHAHSIMSPSGHSIIKDQMKKNNGLLAGELSCHFFFKDRYFGYDDGIYAMLRLFEILVQTGKSLQELLTIFPTKYNTPEFRIACNESQMESLVEHVKAAFVHNPEVRLMTLDGIRVIMKDGWGMIRPSNTQPVVCLRFESDSPQGLERIKNEFIEILKPYISNDSLKELK
jgi:phosphomannomutase / phosphoglucomutase